MNDTLILLTKTFPYGHQETYLFNELPYLTKEFKKVIIVPYDEFRYLATENRINNPDIEVFNINAEAAKHKLTFSQKMDREIQSWKIYLFEIVNGRESLNHIKFYKRNLSQLRHSYSAALSLKNLLKKNNVGKIIFYNYWLHGGVIISKLCSRLLGNEKIPVVSRAHAYDVYHKDWYTIFPESKYLFLGFESWKVYHTDKIFTISQHAFNHFVKLFPKQKEKFSISRLGVTLYNASDKISNNQSNEARVIVSCSNIDNNKRIYRIPEILSKLNGPVKWIHFGSGEIKDVEKLQSEIKKYNLQDSCSLKGFIPNAEVIKFYKTNKVDLILNLSRIEGIPVALMEASSFGIPMLATKTVGNPEIVNNNNGFLVDVDFKADEIGKLLNTYFKNPEEIKTKRTNSRKIFEEQYNASKNYPEFIHKIKEIADTQK